MSRTSSTFGKRTSPILSATPVTGGQLANGSAGKRVGSASNMRKSADALAASFNSLALRSSKSAGPQLEHIESEYIKNLQQQVYFMELEANYLREQARRATEMHPHMKAEAERMLDKLRGMHGRIDELTVEAERRQTDVDIARSEQQKLLERLKRQEEFHSQEKRVLVEEMIELKKEKEMWENNGSRREARVVEAQEELDKSSQALQNADTRIAMLKSQLEHSQEQHTRLQASLDEKRAELVGTQTALKELEEKHQSCASKNNEQVVAGLRTEVMSLSRRLREAEMSADQERVLRSKLSVDSSQLVQENAELAQKLAALTAQLQEAKDERSAADVRRSADISELVALRDQYKQQGLELEQAKVEIHKHQEQISLLLAKLSKHESSQTSTELSLNSQRSRLKELEALLQSRDKDNAQLRHDKELLVDHVADMQRQGKEALLQSRDKDNAQLRHDKELLVDHVADMQIQLKAKDRELLTLHACAHQMEAQIREVEQLKSLEASMHSQKWEELSRLADSMKTLSRSVVATSTSGSLKTAQAGHGAVTNVAKSMTQA